MFLILTHRKQTKTLSAALLLRAAGESWVKELKNGVNVLQRTGGADVTLFFYLHKTPPMSVASEGQLSRCGLLSGLHEVKSQFLAKRCPL